MDFLDWMYGVRPHDMKPFGSNWVGPTTFPHGEWVLVGEYKSERRSAKVYCSAMPARFYKVECGDLVLTTGSDMAELAWEIAKALADNMLGVATCVEENLCETRYPGTHVAEEK